jgi:hypothetical protein
MIGGFSSSATMLSRCSTTPGMVDDFDLEAWVGRG